MKIRIHCRRFSRSIRRRTIRVLEAAFFIAGTAALAVCAWAFVEAAWFQSTRLDQFDNREFESSARGDLFLKLDGARTSPDDVKPQSGFAFSKIEIARLGISAVVVEGVEPRQLRLAVGHVPGTAFPGDTGNIVVAAHRDTFFRPLADIHVQDRITLTTLTGVFEYSVESTRVVDSGAVEVLASTDHPTLTLITCYPFSYIGPAPQRFIVKAQQESAIPTH